MSLVFADFWYRPSELVVLWFFLLPCLPWIISPTSLTILCIMIAVSEELTEAS